VESGVRREFLWEECERSRAFSEIDYCLGRRWSQAKCFRCGGCPSKDHVKALICAKQERKYDLTSFKQRITLARSEVAAFPVHVRLDESSFGAPRKHAALALARALMLACPSLAPGYFGPSQSYWGGLDELCQVLGQDLLTLNWQKKDLCEIQQALNNPATLAQINSLFSPWGVVLTGAQDFRPKEIKFHSPFELNAESYLASKGLKYTLRRENQNKLRFEFSRDSTRKGIVLELSANTISPGSYEILLVPGPKFETLPFLQTAFALKHKQEFCRIKGWAR
jgi:hypothetical protein